MVKKEKIEQNFLSLIEDKYSAFLVRDESTEELEVISTGSLALDVSIGVGGIPRGKFTTLYGPESSGKTTLALSITKQAYLRGLKTLYIDPENGLDYKYVEALVGTIDSENLVIIQPETAEQAFEIAEAGINSGEFGLIIFDSLGALAPKKVKEGEFNDAHVALVARMVGQFLARNAYQVRLNNVAFLFVNQIRAKIGGYVAGYEMPGGYALKHDSSVIIFLSKGEEIKQGVDSVGIMTRFVIKKNKLSAPFKTNFIPIIFGEGIDSLRDIVLFAEYVGILNKRGAYYTYEGETLGQGLVKTMEALRDRKDILDKIISICYNINIKPSKEIIKEEFNEEVA